MDRRSISTSFAPAKRPIVVNDVLRRPLPVGGGRMAVESVAECLWNGWPNQRGISGRMAVEWVAEWAWNTQPPLGGANARGRASDPDSRFERLTNRKPPALPGDGYRFDRQFIL